MNDLARRLQVVHGLAALCAALMLATVALSAFMRLSQAGVGCDPWPACYAETARAAVLGASAAPPGPGVAAARMAHRVVASMVLVLAITLMWATLRPRPVLRREARLSAAILALALGLAALGIVTPGARTPAVVLGNLLGGFLTLALCVRLAAPVSRRSAWLGRWATVTTAVVVLQVALGALVSGTHALPSCHGLTDCFLQVDAVGWNWSTLNPWQIPRLEPDTVPNPAAALVQGLHRLGAIVLLPLLALLAVLAWRRRRRSSALLLAALVILQAAMGWFADTGGPSLADVLLHNLLAALTLALVVRLI